MGVAIDASQLQDARNRAPEIANTGRQLGSAGPEEIFGRFDRQFKQPADEGCRKPSEKQRRRFPSADYEDAGRGGRLGGRAGGTEADATILLGLVGLTTFAGAFVICSGGSERQLDAIADGVIEGMRAEKVRPIGRAGTAASHWVLVDFGSVIVHIFTPPEREYYGPEKHWSDARTLLSVQSTALNRPYGVGRTDGPAPPTSAPFASPGHAAATAP